MDDSEFLSRLATILEVPSGVIPPQFRLADGAWDSLAMVSTVALIDEATGLYISADQLSKCVTAGDVLAIGREPGKQT
jgi:acyl carrier protein